MTALTVHNGGTLLVRAEPSSTVDHDDAVFLLYHHEPITSLLWHGKASSFRVINSSQLTAVIDNDDAVFLAPLPLRPQDLAQLNRQVEGVRKKHA